MDESDLTSIMKNSPAITLFGTSIVIRRKPKSVSLKLATMAESPVGNTTPRGKTAGNGGVGVLPTELSQASAVFSMYQCPEAPQ